MNRAKKNQTKRLLLFGFMGMMGMVSQTIGAQMTSMTIHGKLIKGGVECPLLHGDDGQRYSLMGNVEKFQPGQRVKVEGRPVEISHCRNGTSLIVQKIELLLPPRR